MHERFSFTVPRKMSKKRAPSAWKSATANSNILQHCSKSYHSVWNRYIDPNTKDSLKKGAGFPQVSRFLCLHYFSEKKRGNVAVRSRGVFFSKP